MDCLKEAKELLRYCRALSNDDYAENDERLQAGSTAALAFAAVAIAERFDIAASAVAGKVEIANDLSDALHEDMGAIEGRLGHEFREQLMAIEERLDEMVKAVVENGVTLLELERKPACAVVQHVNDYAAIDRRLDDIDEVQKLVKQDIDEIDLDLGHGAGGVNEAINKRLDELEQSLRGIGAWRAVVDERDKRLEGGVTSLGLWRETVHERLDKLEAPDGVANEAEAQPALWAKLEESKEVVKLVLERLDKIEFGERITSRLNDKRFSDIETRLVDRLVDLEAVTSGQDARVMKLEKQIRALGND